MDGDFLNRYLVKETVNIKGFADFGVSYTIWQKEIEDNKHVKYVLSLPFTDAVADLEFDVQIGKGEDFKGRRKEEGEVGFGTRISLRIGLVAPRVLAKFISTRLQKNCRALVDSLICDLAPH